MATCDLNGCPRESPGDYVGQMCEECFLEALEIEDSNFADEMCPNCVTPWKCNGPHLETDAHE